MSSIPTKQIDGDVAVGRNVSMGGTGTVRGSLTVGHNLTVEGWLEAKNVKGPNKGLFKTAAQLRESYPNPQDGWWALVAVEGSASSDHLGQLFMADGGTWVAQVDSDGNALLKGNPTIDSTEYLEAVEQMTADLDAVKVDVSQNATDIKSLRSTQTTQGDSINSLSEKVTQAQADITAGVASIATLNKSVTQAQADIDAIEASKGKASGIAPLGEDGKISSEYMPENVDDVLEFSDEVESVTVVTSTLDKKSTDEGCAVVYNTASCSFIIQYTTTADGVETKDYYNDWLDAEAFGTTNGNYGKKPHAGKIYIDVKNNKSYRWNGSDLVVLSSDLALGHSADNAFPGDEGVDLQDRMKDAEASVKSLQASVLDGYKEMVQRSVLNADKLLSLGQREVTFSVVLEKLYDLAYSGTRYVLPGVIVTFYSDSGWQAKQWTNFGSKTEADWKNEANWTDFGANGTSVGNTINVNVLCGDTEYTLSTAIKAVQDLETESGMSYFKTGIVLTYRTAETNNNGSPVWKAYQFTRAVEDINPADEKPWVEFGGGGNTAVTTTDTPEAGSKEPFSAGGAYTNLPTTLAVDTETEGVVKMSMKNADGDTVGDEVQFAVGTGSGGSSGTIVSIQFEESPFYAKAGSEVILKASIRSITSVGSVEQDNAIAECVIKDRDTGQTLETYKLNQKSSASADTYDFSFDVSSYFVTATSKRLQLVVTDDAGNTGMRNINVSGVDVTVTSVQTLNYTASTSLVAGGASKNIPMYKFANNASDKGIKVITEILLDGEWQTLGTSVVTDTYSHSISIDPKNCLGKVLEHGAYSLRIHGEDVGSGVVGNYLHTAVMVIEEGNTTPIVVSRWYTDSANGVKKLYETIEIDYAVYVSTTDEPQVEIYYDGEKESSAISYRTKTGTYTKQVLESVHDGSKSVVVKFECGGISSQESPFVINGSLVDVEEVTDQREFNITMDSRNNTETDHSIEDSGVKITTSGCNWSTTGFVKDSYGTSTYGTDQDSGRMALRIAEDMTAECSYQPFASSSIEQNGMALSFTVRVKNVEDRTAKLIDCLLDNKMGFYLTGEKLVFTCDGGSAADPDDLGAQQTAIALYRTDRETRFDIVMEPSSIAPYSGIGSIKIYVNGDEAAATHYTAGRLDPSKATIKFDGTKADLYLYRITGWATYYNFRQAFNNYLVGLKDTSEMLSEYEKNNVMASQTAEGTTKDRPTLSACMEAGLCTVTLLKNTGTEDIEQSYPGYLDTLDGDKKTKAYFDVVVRFPDRPWQDFKAYNVTITNQGTTSSMRPIKNKKLKLKGCTIELLHTEDDYKDNAEQLAKFKACEKNAKKSKIQVVDGGLWVKTICVKVDYSDSTGANNGATMELMNKMQRSLGSEYMTPAQVFYNGEGTMNTSIDSVSAALFRTDKQSVDATNETYAYFHAKANFNVDKGNPDFFGFEKVSGYTDVCVNYGDFKELVAAKGQSLADYKTEVLKDTSALVASEMYMLSEYCGPGYVFLENDGSGYMSETTAVADATAVEKTLAEVLADSVSNYDWGTVYQTTDGKYAKYVGGTWQDTTGEFVYDASTKKWTATGRALNPTECFEYLKYDSFCWLQGVNSIDDMMTLDGDGKPIWLQYYESRYPDDDDLTALYEAGKKAPYNLYRWLAWAQQCSHMLDENDGNITLHGETVEGTKANRLKKWSEELWEYANVRSTGCYVIASDYILAVDQRSKNMMVAFYLDTTGKKRAYFNHWYDGDCTWLADNDCGLTVPWDLDAVEDPKHYYQGWNSVMFKQSYAVDKFWTSANGATTVTLHDIAGDMRGAEADGIKIFSADGCEKLWITDRIAKYAKVISSFDGERKYIENSKEGSNYYYAVHGLRQEDLPETFEKRFAYRDGYYQVGDLYNNPFKMRAVGTDISIKITAAQDGFFGLGVDRADTCTDSCYLKAGESYTLESGVTADGSGTMLYVFGASKLASLDLSGCTPKAEGWDISTCTLLQELILGGEDYSPVEGSGPITRLNLGNKSFLKKIDIRNTKITSVTATYCPRLKEVLASGSALTNIDIAETAPITTLQLPATMTTIWLKNLPNLTYPGGLTLESTEKVTKLFLDSCPNVDTMQLLEAVTSASALKSIRIPDVKTTATVEMLRAIKNCGTIGIDANGTVYEESGQCSGIIGRWIMKELIEDSELAELNTYFPKLEVINSQFSVVMFDDTMSDQQNVTNLDNNTTGDSYEASGHVVRIRKRLVPVKGKLNTSTGVWEGERISNANYHNLVDGTEFDYKDSTGEGFDVMMRIPHLWYKGVNDYKNQKKYICWSSLDTEPLSTANNINRQTLENIVYKENAAVMASSVVVGESTLATEGVIVATTNYNAYKIDVTGMKQVRWPGVNHSQIGGVFVNASGVIISTFNMAVSDSMFDFVEGDYIFTDVPDGAVAFVFGSVVKNNALEAIAVDSAEIEAIEPDWVENDPCLGGVYQASVDSMTRLRSVSGVAAKTGDGTRTTSTEWTYDAEGNPTNTPVGTLHYTYKDFMNLAARRGAGYQLFDYEMSKLMAILYYSLTGSRDAQIRCGYGGRNLTGGYSDTLGNTDSVRLQINGNKCLGFESFFGCMVEVMDNVGINIRSFALWKKGKMTNSDTSDPQDYKWHIYDPVNKTERVVQGFGASGNTARVKHGRYCDIIASKIISDNVYATYYCDCQSYNNGRGNVIERSDDNAGTYAGLATLYGCHPSWLSGRGSRLAFRGKISVENDVA
jgi:hypothetical protein